MPKHENLESQLNKNTKKDATEGKKETKVLNQEEAKQLVTEAGPSFGHDVALNPRFPKERTDIAIIQRDAWDGSFYNHTKWYIVFDNGKGTQIEQLYDTHKYPHHFDVTGGIKKEISDVKIIDGELNVSIAFGDNRLTLKKKLSELGLD